MNANFFGLKRAFHGTLRITRASLARLGLTAARFDLLHALPRRRFRTYKEWTLQSALRRDLGVSRPTVSRMLASLEELRLVRRRRHTSDRRQVVVTLTRRGLMLIRKCERVFIQSGWAQLALDTAFDTGLPRQHWCDDGHCFIEMENLESLLRRIRDTFGDFASLFYPWHPDD